MNNSIDLKGLLPDLSFSSGITVDSLSAIFILTLIALFIIFTLLTLIEFFKSLKQIKFYRTLVQGLGVSQLYEQRKDISDKAFESKLYGDLWREFDESLVAIPEKKRLC